MRWVDGALAPRVALVGTAVEFLTCLCGVGGGFVIVPALTLLLGFTMPQAVGTSLLVIAIDAAPLWAHDSAPIVSSDPSLFPLPSLLSAASSPEAVAPAASTPVSSCAGSPSSSSRSRSTSLPPAFTGATS
jgi:hypothetical protein